ncbi:aldo/keto reductase [Limnospira fusiformis]|uniref:aldo/keto reductase n=1 Tax=Limnospira fusiformis TaxID=54297 RepID=UPI0034E0A639
MKLIKPIKKLALGTVQLGLPYGISNVHGRIDLGEAERIIVAAKLAGMDTLDTAIAYGESEQVLGQVGVSSFKIISKLPALPDQSLDLQNQVIEFVEGSLERLRITQLYGLLLHRPGRLLDSQGVILYQALQDLKNKGLVKKIGVSIYSPTELEALCRSFEFDLIQAPFNIFDRRLERQGWLDKLKKRGVEVHVRSIFLQGLLLMDSASRPPYFDRWEFLFKRLEEWCKIEDSTLLEACLGTAWLNQNIDRIIVGVDSLAHLQEIVATITDELLPPPDDLYCEDTRLINPSEWKLS